MSTKSLSQVVSRVRQRLRRGQTPQQQPPDLCRWSSYVDPFPPITFGGYRRYYETHGKPNPKLFPIPECYLTPAVADLHAAGGDAVGRAATAAAGAGKSVEKVVVGSPRALGKTKTPSRSSTSASQQPSSDSSFSSSPSDESAFSHWTTRTETTATPPPTEGSCEERDDDSEKRLSGSLRRLQLGESDWRESVSSYCTAPTHFEDDDDI